LREEIRTGRLPDGYGIENGVALHFVGTALHEVVTEVDGKAAWHFARRDDGVVETRLEARALPGAARIG
jgi:hypothetical protein